MSLTALAILTLGAYRLVRLVGWDDITDPVRRRVTRLGNWTGGPLPPGYRARLDKWIHCPWCQGFWVSATVTAAWWAWPHATVTAMVPFAVSSGVGLIAKNLDP